MAGKNLLLPHNAPDSAALMDTSPLPKAVREAVEVELGNWLPGRRLSDDQAAELAHIVANVKNWREVTADRPGSQDTLRTLRALAKCDEPHAIPDDSDDSTWDAARLAGLAGLLDNALLAAGWDAAQLPTAEQIRKAAADAADTLRAEVKDGGRPLDDANVLLADLFLQWCEDNGKHTDPIPTETHWATYKKSAASPGVRALALLLPLLDTDREVHGSDKERDKKQCANLKAAEEYLNDPRLAARRKQPRP